MAIIGKGKKVGYHVAFSIDRFLNSNEPLDLNVNIEFYRNKILLLQLT